MQWTEGPVWHHGRGALLFTDTVAAVLYEWSPERGLSRLLNASGGCVAPRTASPVRDAPRAASDADEWSSAGVPSRACAADQLEPGANGMALPRSVTSPNTATTNSLLVCQHGARRVSRLSLDPLRWTHVLASHYKGRRLNGPNDLVTTHSDSSIYFTDPYYAFLEASQPYDGAYTDAKSELGFAGIYRIPPTHCALTEQSHAKASSGQLTGEVEKGGGGFVQNGENGQNGQNGQSGPNGQNGQNVQLLSARLQRPNGIGLTLDEKTLWVSECCQGGAFLSRAHFSHTSHPISPMYHRHFFSVHCAAGLARWIAFELIPSAEVPPTHPRLPSHPHPHPHPPYPRLGAPPFSLHRHRNKSRRPSSPTPRPPHPPPPTPTPPHPHPPTPTPPTPPLPPPYPTPPPTHPCLRRVRRQCFGSTRRSKCASPHQLVGVPTASSSLRGGLSSPHVRGGSVCSTRAEKGGGAR